MFWTLDSVGTFIAVSFCDMAAVLWLPETEQQLHVNLACNAPRCVFTCLVERRISKPRVGRKLKRTDSKNIVLFRLG